MKAVYGKIWRSGPGLFWGTYDYEVSATRLSEEEIDKLLKDEPWVLTVVDIIDYIYNGHQVLAVCKTEEGNLTDIPLRELKVINYNEVKDESIQDSEEVI